MIHSCTFPDIPLACSFIESFLWQILSNAFRKSTEIISTTFPLFKACFHFSVILSISCSVDLPFVKPHCSLLIRLLSFRWLSICLQIPLSNSLPVMLDRDRAIIATFKCASFLVSTSSKCSFPLGWIFTRCYTFFRNMIKSFC